MTLRTVRNFGNQQLIEFNYDYEVARYPKIRKRPKKNKNLADKVQKMMDEDPTSLCRFQQLGSNWTSVKQRLDTLSQHKLLHCILKTRGFFKKILSRIPMPEFFNHD